MCRQRTSKQACRVLAFCVVFLVGIGYFFLITGQSTVLAQDLRVGSDSKYIEVYGQIDKGFLFYDDGTSSKFYPLVDNDSSSTRFGVRAHELYGDGTVLGANAEFEWEPYSTGAVNQLTDHDVDYGDASLRNAEFYISYPNFGKIWIGHGSMASDGSSEVDLSGTSLVGYASVGDIASAQLFRFSNDRLSDIQIGDVFSDLDGLGSKNRVRYDTVAIGGFSAGTSIDLDANWDLALNYGQKLGDFNLAAEIAYTKYHGVGNQILNGSFSALHEPTGWSVTVAAGRQDLAQSDPGFIYGKLGYQADWTSLGRTYLSVDAYTGEDLELSGSRSASYGLSVVQNVAAINTDFYLGLRTYQYDEPAAGYLDGHAVIFGSRIKF